MQHFSLNHALSVYSQIYLQQILFLIHFKCLVEKWKSIFVEKHLFSVSLLAVEDLFESVNDREIRQVFEGQNRIHLEIKQLNRQLAMILDEQRRYVSVITEEISKRTPQAQSGQVGTGEHGSLAVHFKDWVHACLSQTGLCTENMRKKKPHN